MKDAIVIPTSALRRVFIMLLVLLAIIFAILVIRTRLPALLGPGAADVIDANAYQAVFLTNGSTYFGKLQQHGEDWFLLTDVFYLAQNAEGTTQLVKRGTEPQGPREPMLIPRDRVLFVENMRDESDVVNLIRQFKAGQLPQATPPPATPAQTAPRTTAPAASPSPTR